MTDEQVPSQIIEAIPSRILRAVSLFIPQPVTPSRFPATTQDARVALETPNQSSERSDDMAMTHLVKSLAQDPHLYVVLLTSDEATRTSATVIGAYFPGPLWLESTEGGEKLALKAGTSHLLFQLEPQFHILRWTKPLVPLRDIIHTVDNAPSLEDIAASDETFGTPYWIGCPGKQGVYLFINPETRSVTLTSDCSDSEVVWYKDVGVDGEPTNKKCETTIKLAHVDIFGMTGSIDSDLATGRFVRAKDQGRYIQDATKPKITGEELKKRIEGFGST